MNRIKLSITTLDLCRTVLLQLPQGANNLQTVESLVLSFVTLCAPAHIHPLLPNKYVDDLQS